MSEQQKAIVAVLERVAQKIDENVIVNMFATERELISWCIWEVAREIREQREIRP